MATASARLEVNDEGAVETITVAGEKFEKLAESTDDASSGVSELEEKLQQLGKGTGQTMEDLISLRHEIKEGFGVEEIPRGFDETKIRELGSIAEDTGVQFSKLAKEIDFAKESSGEIWSQIDELEEKLESSGTSALEFSDKTESVSTSTQEATEELNGLNEVAEKFKNQISDIEVSSELQASEEFEKTSESVSDVSQEAEEATGSVGRLTTSTKQLDQAAEKAGRSMNKFSEDQKQFNDIASLNEQTIRELRPNLSNLEQRIRFVGDKADQLGISFNKLASATNIVAEEEKVFKERTKEVLDQLRLTDKTIDDFTGAVGNLDPRLSGIAEKMDLVANFTQSTRNELEKLAAENQGLRNSFFDATRGAEEYSNSISGVEVRTEAQSDAIRDQIESLSLAEQQIAENIVRSKQLQEQQTSLSGSASNLSSRFENVGRKSAFTNEILFSTGDAIQDMQFGIRGAGNNLAFIAENFVQAADEAGGFTNVLKSVGAGLMGPLGIVVGIQTLIALGPSIIEFFQDSEEGAKDFEKAIDNAVSSLLEFKGEFEFAGFNIDSVEEANETIKELEASQRGARRQLELYNQAMIPLVERAGNLTDEEQESLEHIRQQKEEVKAQIEARSGLIEKIEVKKQTLDIVNGLQDEISRSTEETSEQVQTQGVQLDKVRQIQETIVEQQDEISFDRVIGADLFRNVEEIRTGLEQGLIRNLQTIDEVIQQVKEERKVASGDRIQQLTKLIEKLQNHRKELKGTEEDGKSAFESIKDVQDAINNDEIDTPKKAGKAISFLEDKLKTTKFESEDSRKKIKRLLEILRELNGTAKKSGQELPKSFGDAFEELNGARIATEALTGAFQELGSAIGNQEPILKSFGAAAMNLLASVASQIGDILIAKGAALIASSIFGDVSAIGRGSALIGIGTGLKATAAAAKGVFGGGGGSGGGGSSRGREVSGGGEGGFDPGGERSRRRGGPVQGGQLYETHGLGNREFFVPNMDGAIMTQDQMRSTSQTRQRDIRVTTENRLEGSIDGPDLFELDTRLKEVEQFKDKFAKQ
jgi:chromosome segregation ATPase